MWDGRVLVRSFQGGFAYERKMAEWRGLCSPGEMKYYARIVRVSTRGMSHVCLRHNRFVRLSTFFAFLRFRPRSLGKCVD